MIRLLDVDSCELPSDADIKNQQDVPYVIISHAWEKQEIVFEDMPYFKALATSSLGVKSASVAKIEGACDAVRQRHEGSIRHLWLDTICIDKKNLTELSLAINSMFRWYQRAEACFVYLADYPSTEVQQFTESLWFTRGWTLQELVAPKEVIFYDRDWNMIGSRESLQGPLTSRTKISQDFLLHQKYIGRASISQRMSWYADRETTVPEDAAYCLLGLFGVNMPLLYGEGKERAFRRLQEEIMRYSDDHSLFAWKSAVARPGGSGLLSESPANFQGTGEYAHNPNRHNNRPFQMTNKGIQIDLYLQLYQGVYVAALDCRHGQNHYLGIFLECLSDATQQYRRIQTNEFCRVVGSGRGQLRSIYVKAPDDI
ncbi:MAG: hypothetical protein Q9219_002665 [cf. Caloplaca sp. 3 TL-2023]